MYLLRCSDPWDRAPACLWDLPNQTCKHENQLPCSWNPKLSKNATACNNEDNGHRCKWRDDTSGTGCFDYDCQHNATTPAECKTIAAATNQPNCKWDKGGGGGGGGGVCSPDHGGGGFMSGNNCDVQGWDNKSTGLYSPADRKLGTLDHFDHLLLENSLFCKYFLDAALSKLIGFVWSPLCANDASSRESTPIMAGGNGTGYDCPGSGYDTPSCVPKKFWSNTTLIAQSVLPMFARMFHAPGKLPHINTGMDDGACPP